MTYLVDSNVLSEWTKSRRDERVVQWFRKHVHEICVNPIILGEVEYGLLRLPPSRRRRELRQWFDELSASIDIIDFDGRDGLVWAQLLEDLRKKGRPMPVTDSLIAASAISRGLTLVTRNVRDFRAAGIHVLDPFDQP